MWEKRYGWLVIAQAFLVLLCVMLLGGALALMFQPTLFDRYAHYTWMVFQGASILGSLAVVVYMVLEWWALIRRK